MSECLCFSDVGPFNMFVLYYILYPPVIKNKGKQTNKQQQHRHIPNFWCKQEVKKTKLEIEILLVAETHKVNKQIYPCISAP